MTIRSLRPVALAGAVAFLAEGALEAVQPQAQPLTSAADFLMEGLFAAGLLLTLAGLLELHLRQGAAAGALGTWGFRLAAVGQGALGLVALASLARGHDVLGPLFAAALLAWLVGTVLTAVAGRRAGVVPAWAATALPVALVAGFAVGAGGLLVLGLAWFAVLAALGAPRTAVRPALA